MPIKECKENGLSGFQYGDKGKCYTYSDESNKEEARQKAIRQMKARFAGRRFNKMNKYMQKEGTRILESGVFSGVPKKDQVVKNGKRGKIGPENNDVGKEAGSGKADTPSIDKEKGTLKAKGC